MPPPSPPPFDDSNGGDTLDDMPQPPNGPRPSMIPGPPPRASLIPGPPPPPQEQQQQHRPTARLSVIAIPFSDLPPPSPLSMDASAADVMAVEEHADEAADQLSKLTVNAASPASPHAADSGGRYGTDAVPGKGSVKKLSLLFSGGGGAGASGSFANRGRPAPLIDLSSSQSRGRTESGMPMEDGRAASSSLSAGARSILPVKQETATVSQTNAMHARASHHLVPVPAFAMPHAFPILVQRDEASGRARFQNAQHDVLVVKAIDGKSVEDYAECRRELDALPSTGGGEAQLECVRIDMHVLCPKCRADFDLKFAQRVLDVMSARCPACRQILSVDTKADAPRSI